MMYKIIICIVLSILILGSRATLFEGLPPNVGFFPFLDHLFGVTTTTEDPEKTTTPPVNIYNKAGWETDSSGNVYVGDDNAKLFYITTGSFWPFPAQYPTKK